MGFQTEREQSMAERIQLKEPGSELVMAVAKVTSETVENIDYFLFANGKAELLVPKTSVLSQMERLGVDSPANIAGKTIRFSRSTKLSKYGKAFWNLDLASGAEQSAGGEMGKPHTGTSASAPSADSAAEKPKQRAAYKALTEWVLKEIVPLYDAEYGEGQCGPDVTAACVQTLFIQACKSGKVE